MNIILHINEPIAIPELHKIFLKNAHSKKASKIIDFIASSGTQEGLTSVKSLLESEYFNTTIEILIHNDFINEELENYIAKHLESNIISEYLFYIYRHDYRLQNTKVFTDLMLSKNIITYNLYDKICIGNPFNRNKHLFSTSFRIDFFIKYLSNPDITSISLPSLNIFISTLSGDEKSITELATKLKSNTNLNSLIEEFCKKYANDNNPFGGIPKFIEKYHCA